MIVLVSPLVAPVIGSIAKDKLWIETPLIEAARYGDGALVVELVEMGADPMLEDGKGRTALDYTDGIPNPRRAVMRWAMQKDAVP